MKHEVKNAEHMVSVNCRKTAGPTHSTRFKGAFANQNIVKHNATGITGCDYIY